MDQVERGRELYRAAVDSKAVTEMGPGQRLLNNAYMAYTDRIKAEVAKVEEGRAGRGRPALAVSYLRHLQADQVAYIAARTILDAAGNADGDTKTAMSISKGIEEQYRNDELAAAAPGLAYTMSKSASQWSTAFHKRAIMRMGAKIAGVSGLGFEPKDSVLLGTWLVRLFIEVTGLVEIVTLARGTKSCRNILNFTPETSDWMTKMHGHCELLKPRYLPMVHPPKAWTRPNDGGYLTQASRTCIVKGANRELQDELFGQDLSKVYAAVNAVQATPWRINAPVLHVIQQLSEEGSTLGGLAPVDPLPLPEQVETPAGVQHVDLPQEMRDAIQMRKHERRAIHELNASNIQRRISLATKINMAKDLVEEEAIYFPHNLDWRGRIYPTSQTLTPQGDDVSKALLQFSEAKPLGEEGVAWLFIHISNLFGVDKVSLEDRIAWTEQNMEKLLDSGMNPLDGDRFWAEADSPFNALAACFELVGYSIAGPDYQSRLPIAQDGTCSGLQHFSGMLKDEVGGKAVNLTPADSPSDIYLEVAAKVEELLLKNTDLKALAWRGNVSRKIVKQPCMTFAYSATITGMRGQILAQLNKIDTAEAIPGHDNWEMAVFLAPLVDQAIRMVVKRGAEGMTWLKAVIRPASKVNSLIWNTPDGFLVHQRYTKFQAKRISTWYNGEDIKVSIRLDSGKSDPVRHASGIAPNFVHALDATHLRMVVAALREEGIQNFAMIHDSFGTHACDVPLMNAIIRDKFIEMYDSSVLDTFAKQIQDQTPDENLADLPEVPQAGNLDLELVRQSDFFFS
tara:strand:- start:31270 stop:33651 length:2382 start_codon:yes stop_codon:yes gene_type:complete